MCQWEGRELESYECTAQPARHKYYQYDYYLCRKARRHHDGSWKTCSDFHGMDGQEYPDRGTSLRNTPCPVCMRIAEAEQEYANDMARAQAAYALAEAAALRAREQAYGSADTRIRFVSMHERYICGTSLIGRKHEDKKHHRHSYHSNHSSGYHSSGSGRSR